MIKRLLLVVGLITPAGIFSAAGAAAPRANSIRANLVSIHIVTPLTGWGTDETSVLHTADGGYQWSDVTPSIPRGKGFSIGFLPLDPINAHTAWLAAPNAFGSAAPTSAYIFHSTDAGTHWQRLPPLHLGPYYYIRSLQFVDRRHGWMLVIRDVAMMSVSFDIYRTSDGGTSWRRILREDPFSTGSGRGSGGGLPGCDCGQSYSYATATSGWVGGCYCGLAQQRELLFRTNDGGRSWHRYALPLPAGYRAGGTAIDAPVFFTTRVAEMSAYLLARSGVYLDAYHTTDGGQSWRGTTPLKLQEYDDPGGFVDPSHGFLLDGQRLYRTADGGRHWQALPTVLSRENLSQFDVVTAATGFVIESIGASTRTRLLATRDGGRTWQVVPANLT